MYINLKDKSRGVNKKMKLHIEKRKICLLVITISYFVVVKACLGMIIGTDDAYIQSIVSGNLLGRPDAHTMWTTYLFGIIFSSLYKLIPWINWYCIFVLASFFCFMYFSMVLITKNQQGTVSRIVLFLLLFTIFILPLMATINFTYVAQMYCGLSLFVIYNLSKNNCRNYILAAGLFLLLGCLVRVEVFYMTIPFVLLGILYKIVKKEITRDAIVRLIFVCTAFFLVFLVEIVGYSSNEWKKFQNNEFYRSVIYDYYGWPDYEENKSLYNQFGVYEEEKMLLDAKIYNIDNVDVNGFIETIGKNQIEQYRSHVSFSKVVETVMNFYGFLISSDAIIFNMILVGFTVLAYARLNKKQQSDWSDFTCVSIAILLFVAEILYLYWMGRVIFRVIFGVQFMLLITVSGLINFQSMEQTIENKEKKFDKQCSMYIILLVALLFLAMHSIYNAFEKSDENKRLVSHSNEVIHYCNENEDKFFIITNGVGDYSCNFVSTKNITNQIGFGFMSRSPLVEEFLGQKGIHLLKDALISDGIYVIDMKTDRSKIQMNAILIYIQKDYPDAVWDIIDEKDSFAVLKIRTE